MNFKNRIVNSNNCSVNYNSRDYKLSVICFLLVSSTFPVYSNVPENDIILTVKPKICVLNNERQTCKDKLIISWKSLSAHSVCLFTNKNRKSLACWTDSWSGETEQLIKTRESLEFTLKEEEKVVANKKLEVLKNFATRSKRSRKRHPWSIF